jgi:predicted acylesterase/phospholipase RssA
MSDKSVLFFAPLRATFDNLSEVIDRQTWLETDAGEQACCWRSPNLCLRLDVATSVYEACRRVRGHYYDAILIDCRHLSDYMEAAADQEAALYELLDTLNREKDRERRFPFKRIAVLVGDSDRERVDQLIFALGQRHIGACLRDRSLNDGLRGSEERAARDRLVEQLWQFCSAILIDRPPGKKALCAAGGGITGVYYELGVLKCLNDALVGVDVRDFDLYFGISSGAFVTSFISNGFHIDELIANIGEIKEGWPYKLKLRWRDLNLREIPKRVGILQKNALRHVGEIVRGRPVGVTSLLDNYSLTFRPIFNHGEIERALREQFSHPRHSNDFRKLSRKLYIGVTDQDRREHVLLGDEGYDDVPISVAVQASTAVHPFFPSVQIHGRYYTDGGITRTSNMRAAIERGADLIFVIVPFLPVISEEAGFNAQRGNLWILQQDIKTIAYTRFAQVSEEILRRYPHVSCYTFLPSKRMRTLMSQNPLAAENFHPIVTEAYSSTYRRLSQLEYKLAGELAAHGIELELKAVADKVERLKERGEPDASILV